MKSRSLLRLMLLGCVLLVGSLCGCCGWSPCLDAAPACKPVNVPEACKPEQCNRQTGCKEGNKSCWGCHP